MQRRVWLATLALMLTGCAQLPHLQQSLDGAFSLRWRTPQGQWQTQQGKYSFERYADRDVLNLKTPLGTTVASLTITPSQSELKMAGQENRIAPTPEILIEQALNQPLPVRALLSWFNDPNPQAIDGWSPVITHQGDARHAWRRLKVSNSALETTLTITQ